MAVYLYKVDLRLNRNFTQEEVNTWADAAQQELSGLGLKMEDFTWRKATPENPVVTVECVDGLRDQESRLVDLLMESNRRFFGYTEVKTAEELAAFING